MLNKLRAKTAQRGKSCRKIRKNIAPAIRAHAHLFCYLSCSVANEWFRVLGDTITCLDPCPRRHSASSKRDDALPSGRVPAAARSPGVAHLGEDLS
jgi:hypothetical protein